MASETERKPISPLPASTEEMIPVADVRFTESEITAVSEVLRSGWLSQGPRVAAFEEACAKILGTVDAVAVTNGTAALHLAMLTLGLGSGDEVLCPSLTFVATANAIRYVGARPVFVDVVGPEDLTMDPEDIRAKITVRTKAIVAMHYGGYPCDMGAIKAIVDEHGLVLIEDAAHAFGASLDGKPCGSWGSASCFSFFANKTLVTGEGGLIAVNDKALSGRLRQLRSHGMTSTSRQRLKGPQLTYDVVEMGYNYRMDEMRAALGLCQLEAWTERRVQRRLLVEAYRKALSGIPGVEVPFASHPGESAYHLCVVLLPQGGDRVASMARLRDIHGVQTSIHYPPVHHFTTYGLGKTKLPRTDALAERILTLPLYPHLSASQVEFVGRALEETLRNED